MPRTGLNAEEIKDKAVECTLRRMREHGFENVKLIDVARDIGVSHAALYAHFANKEALLDSVSERWLEALDTSLERICNRRKDPVARLFDWFLSLHARKRRRVLRDPELYKAFGVASSAMKPFIERHLANMLRQVTGLVREAMDAGELALREPEEVAAVLLEGAKSFHHPVLVAEHAHEKREALLREVLGALLRGFC